MTQLSIKDELAAQAEAVKTQPVATKVKKEMTIQDMIGVMMPEIKKALPSVMTPERFTRIALSALNNNPTLQQCTPISFIAALMNAAQLGLEPNTPLGQAYLVPYKNKGTLECQFIIGYKGLIDLAYRYEGMQIIMAQTVYENDTFEYEYGLNPCLTHKPAYSDRGAATYFYGIFKIVNGGYGFSVMSKPDMDLYAKTYSKGISSAYSPWNTSYEEMAKKTVIRQALKYAPIKTDFQRALSSDGSIKKSLEADMTEVMNENILSEETGIVEDYREVIA